MRGAIEYGAALACVRRVEAEAHWSVAVKAGLPKGVILVPRIPLDLTSGPVICDSRTQKTRSPGNLWSPFGPLWTICIRCISKTCSFKRISWTYTCKHSISEL